MGGNVLETLEPPHQVRPRVRPVGGHEPHPHPPVQRGTAEGVVYHRPEPDGKKNEIIILYFLYIIFFLYIIYLKKKSIFFLQKLVGCGDEKKMLNETVKRCNFKALFL